MDVWFKRNMALRIGVCRLRSVFKCRHRLEGSNRLVMISQIAEQAILV
jgi:hypothetical protein